ncbi:MAG TPA: hypothetical protein VGH35_10845 [Gaiellaceae bacterium]|jgi:hypothetical protein
MLSVCCQSGDPGRLAALLPIVRPVADEIVVAVDDRADLRLLGPVSSLVDRLLVFPYADPPERAFQWLHEQTSGEWVFRIDDDEAPSAALLDLLSAPPADVAHAYIPRRWLWRDGWLDQFPWRPDWQLRLTRRDAVSFPGLMHVPVRAAGPARYVEAPLYHLDLLRADREARLAKARRYEPLRPGIRLAGLPLNVAYYVPEGRDVRVEPVPPEDRGFVETVAGAAATPGAEPEAVRATREAIDARWADRPLPDAAYSARLEPAAALEPYAVGEVRALDVRVTNLGSETWPWGPEGLPEIRLAYHGLRSALRTPLPHDLAPGESTLVPVAIEAPDEPGRHGLTVDVVHERHRWFGCGVELELEVLPPRRALVLVGQPPGEAAYDERVAELLASLDPAIEPVLVGPKPEWLRDRFGLPASAEVPDGRPAAVYALPAGRRRDRLRLEWQARRLRRHARG